MIIRVAMGLGQAAPRFQEEEANQIHNLLIASPIFHPIVLPPCERPPTAVYESVRADGMSSSEASRLGCGSNRVSWSRPTCDGIQIRHHQ